MRKAIIIGNSNYYGNSSLKNPTNDARAIEKILTYKGFTTELYFNQTCTEMKSTLDSFVKSVNDGDDVIYFYAGHAIEYRDSNYLLPIDFFNAIIENDCLTIDDIQNKLNRKNQNGVKLIIIDACRNNDNAFESQPLRKSISNLNTLIAFSTAPGSTAKDGKGNLSYYTQALIDAIKKYNIPIHDVFRNVREFVIEKTSFEQIPWEHSSLTTKFNFDNISVPKYLSQINRYTFDECYSIKNTDDYFLLAGSCCSLYKYKLKEYPFAAVRRQDIDEHYSIEEIDCNNSLVAFIDSDNNLTTLHKNTLKVKECQDVGFMPFTVSINDEMIFVAGSGVTAKLYDLDLNPIEVINLVDEVLEKTFSSQSVINYKSENLTIMSSAFSERNSHILSIGGSDSIFYIKNIHKNKIEFLNKDTELFTYTYTIDFSRDGKYIATGHEHGKVIFWDAINYKIQFIHNENAVIVKNHFFEFKDERNSNNIMHLKFSNDSSYLVIGTSESKLIFLDIEHNEKIHEIELSLEATSINSFDFDSNNESLLATINNMSYEFKI